MEILPDGVTSSESDTSDCRQFCLFVFSLLSQSWGVFILSGVGCPRGCTEIAPHKGKEKKEEQVISLGPPVAEGENVWRLPYLRFLQ